MWGRSVTLGQRLGFGNRMFCKSITIASKIPIFQSSSGSSSRIIGFWKLPVPGPSCNLTIFSRGYRTNFNFQLQSPSPPGNRTGSGSGSPNRKISTTIYYLSALGVLVLGASYAAVPMYRIFCQAYSYGGTVVTDSTNTKDLSSMEKIKNRQLVIKFNADHSSALQWNFKPRQSEIILSPGETALAFYCAENRTSKPIDGISTYNVLPFEAGKYFNKIQCFCFEEQRLNPGEIVELPVFFYIDPEFVEDPKMENINEILLSYTFFEAKEVPNLQMTFFGNK